MFGYEILAVQDLANKTELVQEFQDLAKKRAIVELIRLSSLSEETCDAVLPFTVKNSIAHLEKNADEEEVLALAKKHALSDDFIEQFIPSYDQLFTREEIDLLLHFYQMEAVQKLMGASELWVSIYSSFQPLVNDILESYPTLEKETSSETPVIAITAANYQQEVLNSSLPVILDIYGDFCSPCKIAAPIFSELCQELQGKVKFAKLNVDEEPSLSQELDIHSVPTFLFFKDGKIVERHIGLRDKTALTLEITKAFL